jgi:hypothetical protein
VIGKPIVAQSIEYYTAEAEKSYDNSKKALQNQINAISGNLAQTQKQINENYAQQQNTLYNQRNQAASNASMQAAGSGGSFGGAANIANKKYYEQTFVPAQTQLNTNQSQALENAQSQANSNRLSLEGQLASLNDEISKAGLARYYQALDNDREDAYRKQQLALQRQQIAAQNAANRYLQSQAQGNGGSSAMEWDFGNGYRVYGTKGGQAVYTKDGQKITAGEFLYAIPTKKNGIQWNKWNDIWKQGVSTKGVGSDTINAFKSNDYNKMMNLARSNQYSYLFR